MGADYYTKVEFLRDESGDHKKKVDALKALAAAGIQGGEIPETLAEYFNASTIEEALENCDKAIIAWSKNFSADAIADPSNLPMGVRLEPSPDEYHTVFVLDVTKLPPNVKRIRVTAWASV